MNLRGEHTVPAPRALVWGALNDPAMLQACIPGIESLEQRSDSEFAATVAARIGPVSARFRGTVTLSERDPPNGYRIEGRGEGGAAGFARGGARVRLADADDGATLLTWEADVQVGGKLAQIGSRLVGGAARRLAGEFFGALSDRLAEAAAAPEAPEADVAAGSRPGAFADRWPRACWIAAAVLAAGAATALLFG